MNNHLLAATCTAYAPREIFFAPKSKCKHTSARHGRKKWTTTYMESDEVHINIDIDVHICVRALCTPLNNDVWQLVSRCIVIKSMKITMACASMCSCLPLPTVWMACNSLRNFQCRRSACVCVCTRWLAIKSESILQSITCPTEKSPALSHPPSTIDINERDAKVASLQRYTKVRLSSPWRDSPI